MSAHSPYLQPSLRAVPKACPNCDRRLLRFNADRGPFGSYRCVECELWVVISRRDRSWRLYSTEAIDAGGAAHHVIDWLHTLGGMDRNRVYYELARHLDINRDRCHVSTMSFAGRCATIRWGAERIAELLEERGEAHIRQREIVQRREEGGRR